MSTLSTSPATEPTERIRALVSAHRHAQAEHRSALATESRRALAVAAARRALLVDEALRHAGTTALAEQLQHEAHAGTALIIALTSDDTDPREVEAALTGYQRYRASVDTAPPPGRARRNYLPTRPAGRTTTATTSRNRAGCSPSTRTIRVAGCLTRRSTSGLRAAGVHLAKELFFKLRTDVLLTRAGGVHRAAPRIREPVYIDADPPPRSRAARCPDTGWAGDLITGKYAVADAIDMRGAQVAVTEYCTDSGGRRRSC